jgi:hypothetical protein
MIHEILYHLTYDKHTVQKTEVANADQLNDRFLGLLAKCTNKSIKQ